MMESEVELPDWDYWKETPTATLEDACAMAFNFDVQSYLFRDQYFANMSERDKDLSDHWEKATDDLYANHKELLHAIDDLIGIAKANFEVNGGTLKMLRLSSDSSGLIVHLSEFSRWAKSMEIPLPEEFPHLYGGSQQNRENSGTSTPRANDFVCDDGLPISEQRAEAVNHYLNLNGLPQDYTPEISLVALWGLLGGGQYRNAKEHNLFSSSTADHIQKFFRDHTKIKAKPGRK